MRLKALGAVAALILVSVACAAVVATRVVARGYATNASNHRLDFQFSGLHINNNDNHRYIGQGNFAWSASGRTQSMRVRSINSISIEENEDARIITISGVGQLGRGGFASSRPNNNLIQGNFSVTFTDNMEGSDSVQFSFSSGSGLNGFQYNFSGQVQSGTLNVQQWTLNN
jgi:opacity protein-like surface antigen